MGTTNNGRTDMTLTFRLVGGNIEISGDSGNGENNWNGTWKPTPSAGAQTGTAPARPSTIVQGANLTAKLVWVLRNAQSNSDYTIELDSDESFPPQTLVFEGKTNVTLRLTGGESEKTIMLTGNGSLFTVASGVTLVLGKNITLRGNKENNAPLVYVNEKASLIMNEGSKITGNNRSGYYGTGGVYVDGGTFTMNGGEISGNNGNGVDVSRGTFNMSSGVISGNSDGGVHMGGTFTMTGGAITGNTASSNGGGVYVYGTFTMSGGAITGNTAQYYYWPLDRDGQGNGSGVYTHERATFTMNGGKISGNTASSYDDGGGGVYSLTFTMNGGEISSNTARNGGGVYSFGTFTMSSGEISGNTASRNGGGVYGSITKKGGTIYGYAAGDVKSNIVKDDSGVVQNNKGHAVYNDDSRRRESTVGPTDSLDPSKTGLAGGWGY